MIDLELNNIENIIDKNVVFSGDNSKKIIHNIKDYIKELSRRNHKVFLLDSFWSKERYNKFQQSRYRREIERRYHIKLSVNDFLQKENIFDYMKEKEINVLKVKSIMGFMSAAELFPVIVSKINADLREEKAHILINDFVLEQLNDEDFLNLYTQIDKENVKFFVFNEKKEIIKSLGIIIDEIKEVK